MKKLIAIFGAVALAACGGDADVDDTATEDPEIVVPATEPAPVAPVTADTMMMPTDSMVVDSMADTTM